MLYAFRIGLCAKVENGSITIETAIDLFNRAHELIIEKKRVEQKRKDL